MNALRNISIPVTVIFLLSIPSFAWRPLPDMVSLGEAIQLSAQKRDELETCEIFSSSNSLNVRVREGDLLRFSYAVFPGGWTNERPFKFSISATVNGKSAALFNDQLNPRIEQSDRGWHSSKISLAPYQNQNLALTFRARGSDGKSGDKDALWGAVRIVNGEQTKKKPNVILISLDALRADRLGVLGSQRPTTPNIDKIAGSGVYFTEAISQSPWTRPSHTSVFTGLYPSFHGLIQSFRRHPDPRLSKDIPTLQRLLHDQGYVTQAFVCRGQLSAPFGFNQGFDHYVESHNHPAELSFGKGIKWIRENHDNPFFLFLHTYEVHHPYTHRFFAKDLENPTPLERTSALYDGDVHHADEWVGRLVDTLDELKLAESTFLILMSDHGEDLSRYTGSGHGHSLYDEILRVPLVFYAPGQIKPTRIENFQAQLIDILPTVLDFIGIDRHNMNIQGRSLVPYLEGSPTPEESIAISEGLAHGPERKSFRYVRVRGESAKGKVVVERFKLILAPQINPSLKSFVHGPAYPDNIESERPWTKDVIKFQGQEFYDLSKDPSETHNIEHPNSRIYKILWEKAVQYLSEVAQLKDQPQETTSMDEDLKDVLQSLGY